jgi:RNA polymerase sigma factor (sigma-70 family)
METRIETAMPEMSLTLSQELSLVRQSRADARAFGALYDCYFPRVYNYVYLRVRDRATADDLVSTIFTRALDRLDTYQEKRGPFGVWLFRIAHNVVVDHYRCAARPSPLPLEEAEPLIAGAPSAEQSLVRQQEVEALLAGVSRLSEREQEIIGFKFGGGLTNRKIAALLGLKENHVAVILYRAMDRLRRGLQEGTTAVALRQRLPQQEIAFAGQVDEAVPFIYAHGGAIKKDGDYALSDPPTVEAVRWFADLALVYGVMPLPKHLELYEPEPEEGRSVVISSSGEGEVAEAQQRWGMIGAKARVAAQEGDAALWSGMLSERQGTGGWNWDFEWGIVPWPRDQHEIVVSQAFAYFISANTPHPEAALRWIDFLTRQPPQLKGIPARRSVAASEPARRAFLEQIGAEAYDACLRTIEGATPVDYGLYLAAERYLGQALLDILENGQDVETALVEAQAALEAER